MRTLARRLASTLIVAGMAVAPGWATTLQRMNLQEMCMRADKIFRGTVITVTPGTLQIGGGELPTVTYLMRVDESFQGAFDTVKDEQVVEITMLGKIAPVQVGDFKRVPVLPETPALQVGESYVLLTTPPSTVGLSATVGLGQGCFHLNGGQGRDLEALNEFDNVGVFSGMSGAGLPAQGPVPYPVLVNEIQAAIQQ